MQYFFLCFIGTLVCLFSWGCHQDRLRDQERTATAQKFLGNGDLKIADVHIVRHEYRSGKTTSFTDDMLIIVENTNGERRSIKKTSQDETLPIKGEIWNVEYDVSSNSFVLKSKTR